MAEKQKVVKTEPKKSVLKNRLKTLAKVGIAAAAVTLGSKVQAQGSPMRRGYATPQPEIVAQPAPVQQVKVTSVAPERSWRVAETPRPMFGHGSRGGMRYTMTEHTVRHTTISTVGGHSRGRLSTMTGHGRHTAVPHMGGHSVRHGGMPAMGGRGRGTGFPGMGRGHGGRSMGPRGGGRQMRPRGRGRGF